MVKTIKIGGGEAILAANAATPYRFKQVFGEDLFKIFGATTQRSDEENIELADTVMKMAYIMMRQGENADMNRLSEEDFMKWLEGYAPMDIVLAGENIIDLYMSSTQGSITPKKE